jgi:hypothetical protein
MSTDGKLSPFAFADVMSYSKDASFFNEDTESALFGSAIVTMT